MSWFKIWVLLCTLSYPYLWHGYGFHVVERLHHVVQNHRHSICIELLSKFRSGKREVFHKGIFFQLADKAYSVNIKCHSSLYFITFTTDYVNSDERFLQSLVFPNNIWSFTENKHIKWQYSPFSKDSPKTKKYSMLLTPTSWKIAKTWKRMEKSSNRSDIQLEKSGIVKPEIKTAIMPT